MYVCMRVHVCTYVSRYVCTSGCVLLVDVCTSGCGVADVCY